MKKKTKSVLAGGTAFSLLTVVLLALLTIWPVTTTLAQGAVVSDFALLDQEPTVNGVSVQCGALKTLGPPPTVVAFVFHTTMTNRGDLGGSNGFVRVTYHDLDFVDYAIPVNTTVQISLAAGGTVGVDDAIKVTSGGGGVLFGPTSITLQQGAKPKPGLNSNPFFTTTVFPSPSPFLYPGAPVSRGGLLPP